MSEDYERVMSQVADVKMEPDAPVPSPPAAPIQPTVERVTPQVILLEHTPQNLGGRPKKNQPAGTAPEQPPREVAYRRAGYFRGALDRIVPTAEKVRFYKRNQTNGKLEVIPQSYSIKDLESTGDIEEFIVRYLVPTYGYGDYEVSLINGKGEETRSSTIAVCDPSKGSEQAPGADMNRVLDKIMERMEKLDNKPAPSLTDKLSELKALAEFAGANKMDPTMLAMMLKSMGGDGDAKLRAELEELRSELRRERNVRALPPPLPMPPAEPAINITELTNTIAQALKPQMGIQEMMALIDRGNKNSNGMDLKEIIATIGTLAPMLKNLLGIDKIDALEKRIEQNQQPTRGLRDALEEWKLIEEVRAAGRQPAPEGETFWGFLNNMVANLAPSTEAIGNMVAKIRAAEKGQKSLPPRETHAESNALVFPPDFDEWLGRMTAAEDDAGRIEHTLKAFQHLAASGKRWKGYLLRVVAAARKFKEGDEEGKKGLLDFVKNFLSGLSDSGKLTGDVRDKTYAAFETHLNDVVEIIVAT